MKRSGIKRNPDYRWPERKHPMVRTKLNKVSPQRQVKREPYRDSRGVAIGDVESILGGDSLLWPKIGRPIRDPRVCRQFHELHQRCWVTGEPFPEAHHLGAGFTRGKRDEMCALTSLVRRWHDKVNTSELTLANLLWLKFELDWPHTDWIRLTLIFGYLLPTPEPMDLDAIRASGL